MKTIQEVETAVYQIVQQKDLPDNVRLIKLELLLLNLVQIMVSREEREERIAMHRDAPNQEDQWCADHNKKEAQADSHVVSKRELDEIVVHLSTKEPWAEKVDIEQVTGSVLMTARLCSFLQLLSAGYLFERSDDANNDWQWLFKYIPYQQPTNDEISALYDAGLIEMRKECGGAEISNKGRTYSRTIKAGEKIDFLIK